MLIMMLAAERRLKYKTLGLSSTGLETGWWLPGNLWSLGKNACSLID